MGDTKFYKGENPMIFQRNTNTVLTIDIGFRNIKIAEIDVEKGDFIYIKKYGIAPTPRGCIRNGKIQDIDKMVQAIKRVIDETGMKAKKAKIVMSGTHIVSSLMNIQLAANEDIDATIKKYVLEYLTAVSENTHEIDYRIIKSEERGGNKNAKVFVTAILKSIVESYIDVLLGLGLKPLSVDIPAYSINKFFKRNIKIEENEKSLTEDVNKNEIFAVFDFGSETTIINILRNKNLEFNKAILRGSSNIDELIAQRMYRKISEGESIKLKSGMTLPHNFSLAERNEYGKIVREIVDEIMGQIKECFDTYKKLYAGSEIGHAYIIGGGSMLMGLKEYLREGLSIPVIPIGLLSIDHIHLDKRLNKDKMNYLINVAGISLE
jgi:type IV pilus assembly protein PilM